MHFILFDGDRRESFLPLTYTRPVAEIRIGILTLREKWERHLNTRVGVHTRDYLQKKFPLVWGEDNVLIKASLLPDDSLVARIKELQLGEGLFAEGRMLACRSENISDLEDPDRFRRVEFNTAYKEICHTWDIFSMNGEAMEDDFQLLTAGRKSAPLSATNRVSHPERIFLEAGAEVEHSILNAASGPIYIGEDALVMEGCLIRGGFALGAHGVVKMGAKIYGPTTAGPYCKIGGEINNSVLFGYSNKGHDGFLGNSVLGEWCNLGADTNTSNMKNNYAKVRLWNHATGRFDQTGLQFCGLIMGDHSKSAINTMFNTGTVVGVNCNIFAAGFPRNFIPSFSWGGTSGFSTYTPEKAFEAAKVAMERRGVTFTPVDEELMLEVFELTREFRKS